MSLRATAMLIALFVLCTLGFGQVTLSAATDASTITALPAGTFAKVTLAPGPNTLSIDINGTYSGQLALKVAYQGSGGPLRTWPSSAIANSLAPGATGIAANATGSWTVTVAGPGYACVVATSLASGTPSVFLASGPGPGRTDPASYILRTRVSDTWQRPADTNAYALGDAVTTATSPTNLKGRPITVARIAGGSGTIRQVRLSISGTGVTAPNAEFRVRFFTMQPSFDATSGDNAALLTDRAAHQIGSWSVVCGDAVFNDGISGVGVLESGSGDFVLPSGTDLYYTIEYRGSGWTPPSAASFTLSVWVAQDQ